MLTPEYIAGLADDILELYNELETAILRDTVRRLLKTGTVTDTARWQISKAQEAGLLYEDVLRQTAKLSGKSDAEIERLFTEAGAKALRFDIGVYRAAGLNPLPLNLSSAASRVLLAGIKKTQGLLNNLTRTTANTSQQAFIHAATIAEMQITSGAFDPATAIRNAIRQAIKESGSVIYPSGHTDRIDVAITRAVRTGVSQTTGEISLQYANDMNCDLMEITAHFGARPSHALWQGQIVSLSGRAGYLSLDDIGYGSGDGFKGWNCRHDWYPYFEGISRPAYSAQRLREYADKTVQYNGETIGYYDATQRQREMERRIRTTRRELAGYDEAMKHMTEGQRKAIAADFDRAAVKLKQQETAYKDFAKQTDLTARAGRLFTPEFNRSVSQKAVHANAAFTKLIGEPIIKTDKQFGKKIGKHASDFGLNPRNTKDRKQMESIIDGIVKNHTEVRLGQWRGQPNAVLFYIKDTDVVLVSKEREFITILKGDVENGRVKNARKLKV